MTSSRAYAAAAFVMSSIALLSGCGSSADDPAGAGSKQPSSAASAGGASAASKTASSSSTVPSNWKTAAIKGVAQLRVPPSWKVSSTAKESYTLSLPKNNIGVSPGSVLFLADALGGGGSVKSNVEDLAKAQQRRLAADGDKKISRLPNETINGALLYHFRYEDDTNWRDMYGTVTSDSESQITIDSYLTKATSSRADEDAMIKKIMATFELL